MVHEIKGILYRIKGYSGIPHYVECESEEDLFRYITKEWIIKGYPVFSINRMCGDGSTPKVRVLSDKRFKAILKEYQNPKKIILEEYYYTNDRGCHYYLTPVLNTDEIKQFHIDAKSKKQAVAAGKEWIDSLPDKYVVTIKK